MFPVSHLETETGPGGTLESVRPFGILPSLWSPVLWLESNFLMFCRTAETALEVPSISNITSILLSNYLHISLY